MREVTLWTDGSSTGAVGDGGWAYVLVAGDAKKEASGYAPDTTNNRMELTALLMGLRALKVSNVRVHVRTDSEHVMFPFTKGWLQRWKRTGWITGRGSKKRPVANQDLWKALDAEAKKHFVTFEWVGGHTGVELNERCDELAKAAKKAGMDQYVAVELPDLENLALELV